MHFFEEIASGDIENFYQTLQEDPNQATKILFIKQNAAVRSHPQIYRPGSLSLNGACSDAKSRAYIPSQLGLPSQ